MIPYIDYNGTRYEFKADFLLKRAYNKDLKKVVSNNKMKFDSNEILKLQKFSEENPKITKEVLEANPEMYELLIKYSQEVNDNAELIELQERYCYEMLKKTYNIDKETWLKMQEQFANDYGIENLELLFVKVIEKVFTQEVENNIPKKPLPEFMN